jgi:hypothetical protein
VNILDVFSPASKRGIIHIQILPWNCLDPIRVNIRIPNNTKLYVTYSSFFGYRKEC